MSFEVLKNEKNVAEVKLHIAKEDFEKAIQKAYQKNKAKFKIDGFRNGKAPKAIIEQRYGKNVFYEDALDEAFPEEYQKCLEEGNFKAVAAPVLLSIDDISEEDGAVITLQISLDPEFEMPEYKGIKIGKLKYTPKKAEVDEAVATLRDKNARLVTLEDGEAKEGDILTIDFEGFENGVAFEGGKAEQYPLELGSHTFIEGFEEQLVGAKKDAELEVNVTFPENYGATNLAGKPAMFKVKVHEIKRKELPELDDDFAVDLGFENLDALTKDAKAHIKKAKEDELKSKAEGDIMDEIIKRTEIDIPEQLIKETTDDIRKRFEERITQQTGLDPETYYKYVLESSEEKDPEQFEKSYREQAIREITVNSVMRKIIIAEEMKATDEEIKAEIAKMAETYNKTVEEVEKTLGDYGKAIAENTILNNKLYDFLLENAEITK